MHCARGGACVTRRAGGDTATGMSVNGHEICGHHCNNNTSRPSPHLTALLTHGLPLAGTRRRPQELLTDTPWDHLCCLPALLLALPCPGLRRLPPHPRHDAVQDGSVRVDTKVALACCFRRVCVFRISRCVCWVGRVRAVQAPPVRAALGTGPCPLVLLNAALEPRRPGVMAALAAPGAGGGGGVRRRACPQQGRQPLRTDRR